MASRKPAADGALVEVRVLRDCPYGLWGQLVEIPREIVAQLKAAALVDDDPAAVAYAKSLLVPNTPES
jgi:hypothetical protein